MLGLQFIVVEPRRHPVAGVFDAQRLPVAGFQIESRLGERLARRLADSAVKARAVLESG